MTTGWKILLALVLLFTVDYVIGRVLHRRGRHRARASWRDRLADLPVTLRHLDDEQFEGDYTDGMNVAEAVEAADETIDVPRPVLAWDAREDGAQSGPGYFHDDAPAGAIKTVRVGGAYLPLSDDTAGDWPPRPEPRAGRPAWETARPNPRVPCAAVRLPPLWVQEILGAPTVDLALADIVAMSRIRALAAA